MTNGKLSGAFCTFLDENVGGVQAIYNEHALQHEIGSHLRSLGFAVTFERPVTPIGLKASTRRPKKELDLLISDGAVTTAIELKVPLSGRVPETLFDFCADIEFVEGVIRAGYASEGYCLLVTPNRQFWAEMQGQGEIYRYFRGLGLELTGLVRKPTGSKDSQVFLSGSYAAASSWKILGNTRLMQNARYLLLHVK